jgi:plasmid stabilization system protein ParE
MKIRQHPAATMELDEAMAWYARRNPQAADGLLRKAMHARELIAAFLLSTPLISGFAHRFVLHGYPYDLIYSVDGENILILAYAHHKRRPAYWKDRLRSTN